MGSRSRRARVRPGRWVAIVALSFVGLLCLLISFGQIPRSMAATIAIVAFPGQASQFLQSSARTSHPRTRRWRSGSAQSLARLLPTGGTQR